MSTFYRKVSHIVHIIKKLAYLDHGPDAFVNSAPCHQVVDVNGAGCLSDPVCPVLALHEYGWCPVELSEYHHTRGGQRQTLNNTMSNPKQHNVEP